MALVDIAPMSFLFILFLIVFSGFGSKPKRHKSKRTLRCICAVWATGSNTEHHINLEGWNSFLILSCLGAFTTPVDAHSQQNLIELQVLLNNMSTMFNVSKASLYTPLPDVNSCTKKLMYCYLLELNVILHEENGADDILEFIYKLTKVYIPSNKCSVCATCESHPLADSTTFSNRMLEFIQKLQSKQDTEYKDCD